MSAAQVATAMPENSYRKIQAKRGFSANRVYSLSRLAANGPAAYCCLPL
jgi:hypothetical protein